MPISLEDCPLMTSELVDEFQRLDKKFRIVQDRLPRLWEALCEEERTERDRAREFAKSGKDLPKVESLCWRLKRLRDELTIKTYRVGFLGRSQVGKSSTVNNVLNVRRDDDPGPPTTPGSGAPATSCITRVLPLAPQQHATCQLLYMTDLEYTSRRGALCTLLGLTPTKDDAILIEELQTLLAASRDDPAADEKNHDRRYLMRLLKSYGEFGAAWVKPEPASEKGTYGQRGHYTNHPIDDAPNRFLLLREVSFGFPTSIVDHRLEMIDLPGLGARLEADDLLTKAYLPLLHGSLVFQSSEQVQAKEAYDLLTLLRRQFGSLERRVWMVVTRFDRLSQDQMKGDGTHGRTILDHLSETLKDNRIPADQVMLVGNEIYQELRSGEENDVEPARDIPEPFRRHEILAERYVEVLRDGGISAIRKAVGVDLSELVQHEVRNAIRRELHELLRELRDRVLIAKRRAEMEANDFDAARSWRRLVIQVATDLERDRSILEDPAKEMRRQLLAEFERICPSDSLDHANEAVILDNHRRDMPHLCDQTENLVCLEIVPRVRKEIRRRLEQYAKQGQVSCELPMNGCSSPLDRLDQIVENEQLGASWYRPHVRSFDDPVILDGWENVTGFLTPREYHQMMIDKINTVVFQTIHSLSCRLRNSLEQIRRELNALGDEQQVDRIGDDNPFNGIIDE